jgi:hypothetical protein
MRLYELQATMVVVMLVLTCLQSSIGHIKPSLINFGVDLWPNLGITACMHEDTLR